MKLVRKFTAWAFNRKYGHWRKMDKDTPNFLPDALEALEAGCAIEDVILCVHAMAVMRVLKIKDKT